MCHQCRLVIVRFEWSRIHFPPPPFSSPRLWTHQVVSRSHTTGPGGVKPTGDLVTGTGAEQVGAETRIGQRTYRTNCTFWQTLCRYFVSASQGSVLGAKLSRTSCCSPVIVDQCIILPRRIPVGTWLKWTKHWDSTGTMLAVKLKPWPRCIYTTPVLLTEQKTLYFNLCWWYAHFHHYVLSCTACTLQLGGNLMEVINHFQTQMLGRSTGVQNASPSSLHSSDLESGVWN